MRTKIIRNREPDAEPVALMGSFMPFAGVRYYKRLTDVDAALGNARIGSVGWRSKQPKPEQVEIERAEIGQAALGEAVTA